MNRTLAIALAAGFCVALCARASAQEFSSGQIGLPITDATTVESIISISGGPNIADLDIRIDLTHTFDGDLDIIVIAPGGAEYMHLVSDVGGTGENMIGTIFDQDAAASITTAIAPMTGSWRPEGGAIAWIGTIPITGITPLSSLDEFDGRSSNGDWRLLVDDDAGLDTGILNEWALIITSLGGPTNPRGVATLSPNIGIAGETFLATVAVTPGAEPVSTGLAVSMNASALDAGTVTLLDNGAFPDAVANDNIFSSNITIGANSALGRQTLPFTVTDAQARSSTGNATFSVRTGADVCGGAIVIPNGALPYTSDAIPADTNDAAVELGLSCSAGGANNAGFSTWFKFVAPTSTTYRFTTSNFLATGNTIPDTVIAIYESTDGTCNSLFEVGCDDDGGVAANGGELHSDETVALNAGTTYYIQVAKWALAAPAAGATFGLYVEVPVTPPTAALTLDPTSGFEGTSVTASVTVVPGSNPVSQSYSVVLDTSSVLGGQVSIFDDGVAPDAVANDGTFTGTFNIGIGSPIGNQAITFGVTDDQGRSANGGVNFNVIQIPTGACCTGIDCQIRREADCTAAGGTYLGDNTLCSSNDGYVSTVGSNAFEDISATGTVLTLTDDSNANAPIGFDFNFFGSSFSDLFVGSNGFLSFGVGSNALGNGAIPSAAVPNNAIYGLWDDLNPGAGGFVSYETRGTPGSDLRFIVQWTNVPQFAQTDSNTFQMVLFANGLIEFRYDAISFFTDADATIGVENADGTAATSIPASSVSQGVSVSWEFRAGDSNCGSCAWQGDGCFPDYDNSGGIDSDDVIAFFGDWDISAQCADVDGSEGVDGDDIVVFFGAWDLGGTGTPGC